jgi:hypothetical protein
MTMRRWCTYLALFAFLTAASTASGKRETPKRRDIRTLLELTGSAKLGMQLVNQLLGQFKVAMTDVPAHVWNEVAKEIRAGELVELVVPIYDKHLEHAEIKDIIKFYQSPAGRKLTAAMPAITQESMQAGQAWGQRLSKRIVEKLKKKGYGKPQ